RPFRPESNERLGLSWPERPERHVEEQAVAAPHGQARRPCRDAIRDCSNRNGVILDPFGGAGTTLIAAEKTGRRACLIEIDPRYVDVTIKRWQNLTRRTAVGAGGGTPYPDNGPRPGDAPPT